MKGLEDYFFVFLFIIENKGFLGRMKEFRKGVRKRILKGRIKRLVIEGS